MDMVNIYTYVEKKGMKKCDRKAGYILELEREGRDPVTLDQIMIVPDATNRQAELRTLAAALRRMVKPAALCIYETSGYVAAGYTRQWVKEWKENGWMKKRNRPVANVEDWKELDKLIQAHVVRWELRECHKYSRWLEWKVENKDKKATKVMQETLAGGYA